MFCLLFAKSNAPHTNYFMNWGRCNSTHKHQYCSLFEIRKMWRNSHSFSAIQFLRWCSDDVSMHSAHEYVCNRDPGGRISSKTDAHTNTDAHVLVSNFVSVVIRSMQPLVMTVQLWYHWHNRLQAYRMHILHSCFTVIHLKRSRFFVRCFFSIGWKISRNEFLRFRT